MCVTCALMGVTNIEFSGLYGRSVNWCAIGVPKVHVPEVHASVLFHHAHYALNANLSNWAQVRYYPVCWLSSVSFKLSQIVCALV